VNLNCTMTRAEYRYYSSRRREADNADRDPDERRVGGMKPVRFDLMLFQGSPFKRLYQLRQLAHAFVPGHIYRDRFPVRLP
jgi:hypothetical protein